jgi:type II secretory pathway pseudopilin PulG
MLRGAQAASLQLPGASRQQMRAAQGRLVSELADVRRRRLRRSARWQRALPRAAHHAFTIIELLIVMAIIIVLAGLILATSGYVQDKGKRSRAEAEIAAMSAALESYKADNGVYPDHAFTRALKPALHENPDPKNTSRDAEYFSAGSRLYADLSGNDPNTQLPLPDHRSYLAFKPQMIDRAPSDGSTFVRDPFGNAYGYSTTKAADPATADGYNPTFDLWSTSGTTSGTSADRAKWIKNW